MKTPQMDLKTFAENEFDPKIWINKAWSSSGNQEKEVFVSNAVSRLQLYMKQLSNSLDETTTQVVTSLPRVIQEATVLQEDGTALQQELLALERKVQTVEAQTGSSIESLQRIDKLKSRLENAASALQEADKWAALTTSLEEILETGVPMQGEPLAELAKQVAAMTQSLEVLSDAPDYDRKRLQLETLYNRLEAALSPPLIEALTHMDSDRTATYVSVFHGMGRMMSVCRCWRRAAAARLSSAWQRLDAHSVLALSRLLVGEAPKQVDWVANVLKSERPLAELVRLYTDLLMSLEPSPTKLTTATLKLLTSPEQGIHVLTDLRRDIEEFVGSIRNIIEAPRPNKENLYPPMVREFGRAAYAPLRELLPKYTEFQSQLLLKHLNDPVLKQENILEHSRGVLSLAERCNDWLESAYNQGRKIAGIAVYPYHWPAVENFMKTFSSHIAAHSRRIEVAFLASASAGQATGVLSETFPAALALQAAVSALLDTRATHIHEEVPAPKTLAPLEDMAHVLLEPDSRQTLLTTRPDAPESIAALRRTKEQLQSLAKSILRQPVDSQLEKIAQLPAWGNNDALTTDLPDFALSPQEYITEIGQYLMTLPQHLEMHLSEKQAPWQFLTDVCVHTCNIYAEKILSITDMDELGTKRCLTDITYLASVVEDLGSSITPSLKSLETTLRAAAGPNQSESQ